jgi:4-hydroxybenzoate polyprenyltransferase
MAFSLLALIRSLRPEQWLKNGFVLAPLVFSGLLLDGPAWKLGLAATAAFCCAASATYLINDVRDRRADRVHPVKKQRPVAAGTVTVLQALTLSLVLVTASCLVAVKIGPGFAGVLVSYLVLTLLYSLFLKNAVFVDVLVVAAGFVLRVYGGAAAIGVPGSNWLLLCAYLLALYLALGKRRAELALLGEAGESHRLVLEHYSLPLVDQAIGVVLGATVLAYALYTVAPGTVEKVGSEGMMATVPVVLYGLFRYLYLLHRHEMGGSPTRVLLTDWPLLACVCLWVVIAGIVIHLGQ